MKKANDMVDSGTVMIKNANDVLVDVKDSKGPLGHGDQRPGIGGTAEGHPEESRDPEREPEGSTAYFSIQTPTTRSDKKTRSSMSDSLSAVVVAAGRSQRMGFDKLLTPLAGRPLLLHTLERLFLTEAPREIVLVVRPGSEVEMQQVIAPLGRSGPIRLVAGGAQRQDSVQNGLQAVSPDSEFVMVHDAARPFVTRELIDTVLAAAKISDAAVCGAPCSDSLKEVGEDGLVMRTVDRSRLWTVQTPQIFRTQLLRDAYRGRAGDGRDLYRRHGGGRGDGASRAHRSLSRHQSQGDDADGLEDRGGFPGRATAIPPSRPAGRCCASTSTT